MKITTESDCLQKSASNQRTSVEHQRPAIESTIVTKLPKEWYDPDEDAIWEAYLEDDN